MKFGTTLSFTAMKRDPAFIREFAQNLDTGGVDYMTIAGHLLSAPADSYPGRPNMTYVGPFRDPFILYSHLAAITLRLEFFTAIMIVPELPTAYVAKQAADLALLSDNRFSLGIGISWNEYEYQAMGQDVHTRGRRMEAQLPLLKKLWTEPYVTHEDRFHKLQNIGLGELPTKPIPLWVGCGTDEKVLRRVAKYADGWLPVVDPTEPMQHLHQYLRDEGRDPSTFMMMGRLPAGEGGADDWKAQARYLKDVGATHLTIGAAPGASPDEELETALRVRDALASDASL
jgi:probable F420-dependent oxidoreductase